MAKPKIPNSRKAALEHRKRIERYAALINQLYDKLNKEAAKAVLGVNPDVEKPFSWSDYPETRKALKELQDRYISEMTSIVMSGTSAEWKESNLVQDLVAQKLLKAYTGTTKAGEEYARYFQTDSDALKAFQRRKAGGMNLSQRVWKLSEQYKTELEESISAAIEPGTSAIELAAEIKKYLNEPDKRFRRVRDRFGELQLSANAKAYHPGQGIYRSSARNAQRLARTEINMAYRTAEQERWKSFDFVVGYEVKITQNGKHVEDICDCLKGKYRKDFKFMGWHPQCYKDDTEVLTNTGWKLFKDVRKSDLIMSLNPDTRAKEWTTIIAAQCYDFNGKMVRFYSKALDCIVTPDHRMVYISAQTGRISHLPAIRYDSSFGSFIDGERRFKKELVPYSGKVYDLTLERNHIMYVRRNGKCFWGSNCMCYAVPILKTEDEFFDDDDDAKSVNEVEDVPQGFRDWVKDNEERIEKAEKRGTVPYFIADNRGEVDKILNGTNKGVSHAEVDAEKSRIEANRRDYNRLKSDPNYTDVEFNPKNGGLKATHRLHNIDSDKGWYETFVQNQGYKAGHSVILESEFSSELYRRFTEGLWDGQKFELATRETATDNNILRGLKHCADKRETEVAILFFPNGGFTTDKLRKAISRYKGYKQFPERTYIEFKRVVCITNEGIVYDAPL